MKISTSLAAVGMLAGAPAAAANFDLVVGSGGNLPSTVHTYRGGQPLSQVAVYPGFSGGVRVATGDVDGDGVADLVTAAGPGGGPHVKVFSGSSGAEIRSFFAYDAGFTGGVNIAAGDLNGDGHADIVTGAGAGGGPHVKVFDGVTGNVSTSFFAFDAGFTGGTVVATGDVLGNARADIIVGAASGNSRIRAFDSATLAVTADFFAFDPAFTGGVSLATGRYQGAASLFVGAGAGGAPQVKIYNLKTLSLLADFLAFDPGFRGGVSVAAGRIGGRDSLIVATASGGGRATVMDVTALRGTQRQSLTGRNVEFEPFGAAYDGGLSVAALAGRSRTAELDADGQRLWAGRRGAPPPNSG